MHSANVEVSLKNSGTAFSKRGVHSPPQHGSSKHMTGASVTLPQAGQNYQNKTQQIQCMLHETFSFTQRQLYLAGFPSALFLLTASVYFVGLFSSNIENLLRRLPQRLVWCSLAQQKPHIMKIRCCQTSKLLRSLWHSETPEWWPGHHHVCCLQWCTSLASSPAAAAAVEAVLLSSQNH